MSGRSWSDCPDDVQQRIVRLVDTLRGLLGANLVGVYLHGSLALGSFNPVRSDVDLLVVTRRRVAAESRGPLAAVLLRGSAVDRKLEIDFMTTGDLHPWTYPPPFDFHFGESQRTAFERSPMPRQQRTNADLAAHVTIVRRVGIALVGPLPTETFPEVPAEHYRDALLRDVRWARERIEKYPVYGVLSGCRVLAYVRDAEILSKAEAGLWGLRQAPPQVRPTIEKALAAYRSAPRDEGSFDPGELRRFTDWVQASL
jgi:streptomycin 3"-adenylyltransferase